MRTSDEKGAVSRELEPVRQRFEAWRRTRTQRRIPDRLWSEAARVAAEHGVSRTARALRLNEQALRERMRASVRIERARATASTRVGFVELAPMPLAADSAGYVLEVESPRGHRLRLEVRGTDGLDVAALARSFVGDEQ